MMPKEYHMPSPSIQVRCRLCGHVLPGWLRIDNKPNGAMLLNHLPMMHPAEVTPHLERMRTEDIGTVAMEAFERVEAVEVKNPEGEIKR
jgi:hypothetical protein